MTKSLIYSILMKAEMSLLLDRTEIFKTQGVLDVDTPLFRGTKSNILSFELTESRFL